MLEGKIFTQASDAVEDRLILFVILLQWKKINKNRQNIVNRDLVLVSHDHTADAATSIVQSSRTAGLEKWLKLAKDSVIAWQISGRVGGVVDKETSSVGSIGLCLWVLVRQTM